MATEHFNKLKEDELERLALLFEDCSEVIHAVGKIIRHGYPSVDPTKRGNQRISNREMLSREIGQLLWSLDQMAEQGDTQEWAVRDELYGRGRKASKYLHHHQIPTGLEGCFYP